MRLVASDLVMRYPGLSVPALENVGLRLDDGKLITVVGPNGSGKSSLLRVLTGVLAPTSGTVILDDRAISLWRPDALARVMAVVTQSEEPAFALRVDEAVMLGRYAHLGPFSAPSTTDLAAVQGAITRCDLEPMVERRIDTLSGGEWQRVRLARALAQDPRLLILDEPTAALDVRHEMQIFELIRNLVEGGLGAVIVTHHLNLAARFADQMLLLANGRVAASGTPSEVLRTETLREVFEWPVAVTAWTDGTPQVVPLRTGEIPPPA